MKFSDIRIRSNIIPEYTFDSFVEGKSNQLARAASVQVAHNTGKTYNPLLIYGDDIGLGKTHLMHAIGNEILRENPSANVVCLRPEHFIMDISNALRHNAINAFKDFYRTVDALLISNIQFFAKVRGSDEEYSDTFNNLLENTHQVVLTSFRYPTGINGLDERLKSCYGLAVAVEPPDLETRIAILLSKAQQSDIEVPAEVAFFIGRCVRSNVLTLLAALEKVIATAQFTGKPITLELAKEAFDPAKYQ